MHTTISIISLFNYIGTTAFIIGGTLAAKNMKLHCLIQFLSGMSTAYFGGLFLRDLILLQTTPAIFSFPWEIAAAVLICTLTIITLKYKEPGNIGLSILCLLDSIGIVSSVAAGYNQGIKVSTLNAFICGFVTACGGGIIATAIRLAAKKNLRVFFTILAANKWYYIFAASMSAAYTVLYLTGHNTNTAIIVLTAIAIIIGFIIKQNNTT